MATDPVCGMFVDEATAELRLVRDNRTYYFCASSCLETFALPERHLRSLRLRLGVAAPVSVAVLVLTYLWHPTDWPWVAAALASVVQVYAGLPFYRGAWDALRSRSGNMDLLVAVGTTAAYGYSLAALALPARLPSAYYFDASTVILTLILAGNYLELLTRDRASGALRRLVEFVPTSAKVVRGLEEVAVRVGELTVGDLVRVRPGARFPSDGVLRQGTTYVDESILTGESRSISKGPGARVLAGSLNGDGSVDVEVSRVGGDTFLAEVGRLMAEAETSRVPLQKLADRIASAFVPFVLALGILAGLSWFLFGGAGFGIALLVFVSVVITACPCAFGIATPAAIVVGTGRAAESGILFKGGDAIERAARIDLVLTDKTGTLTLGTPTLVESWTSPPHTERELIGMAAAVESGSEHPLARAVLAAAHARSIVIRPGDSVQSIPGHGVTGIVEGVPVRIWAVEADGPSGTPTAPSVVERWRSMGLTCSVVSRGDEILGALAFSDPPRPNGRLAVAALRADGVEVVMVTGDHERAANLIAAEVGIREVHSSMTPSGKVELVRRYQSQGRRVGFVGDGVNDAAALLAADVGIAIGTGTEVAKASGQVVLLGSDPLGIPLGLRIARRTVGKVRQNLVWALSYNAILLPIAAGLLVPAFGLAIFGVLPITGAIAMALSSTLVVANSLSLRWIRLETAGSPARVGGGRLRSTSA